MRDYLTIYLSIVNAMQDMEICADSKVSKVPKATFEPFDTSQSEYVPENVLLFRARVDREPDWLREQIDEIEERAAIMEFDGGLLREKAEDASLEWARDWFAPPPF